MMNKQRIIHDLQFIRDAYEDLTEDIIQKNRSCSANTEEDPTVYERYITALDVAIQTLENNEGWILCSERLPEKGKVVLCWVRSTTIASGETFIIGSCDNKCWFLQTYEIGHHHFLVKDYEVVAWQPLPQPYRKENENEQK